jgi:DNA-binding PadR family transcriptional regulator
VAELTLGGRLHQSRGDELLRLEVNCIDNSLPHWHYYVMRRTRDVVAISDPSHYSDPPLLVLASLADGPKHGYAMIEDIEDMCGARLGPGTLYGAITRLERQGLIEPLESDDRRRPYRLTAAGRRAVRAKLATMRQVVLKGLRKLEAQ